MSAEESDTATGFFGTGLKYATASTLRPGGEVTSSSDGHRFDILGEGSTLRDKAFTRVTINGEPLGFTTELGKQWEPWMVVREMYSNALGERGGVSIRSHPVGDQLGQPTGQAVVQRRDAVHPADERPNPDLRRRASAGRMTRRV